MFLCLPRLIQRTQCDPDWSLRMNFFNYKKNEKPKRETVW